MSSSATVVSTPTTITFNDHPVRCFDKPESCVPLVDIGKAIGTRSQDMSRMIKRDPVLVSYMVGVTAPMSLGKHATRQGKLNCITKEGIVGLMVKLNTSRIKDPEKKARVQEFQKWAITTLRAAMDKQAATPTKPQLPPPAPTLTPEQQHAVKAAVASIAQESYLEIRKAYSRTWNDLKDYFRVARYQDIPESRFVEAMRFLGAPLPDDSVLPAKKPLPSENNLEAMALKGVLSVAKMAKDHKDDLYLAHSNAKDAVFKAVKELEDTMARLNDEYSKIHDVLEHLPLYARGLVTEK